MVYDIASLENYLRLLVSPCGILCWLMWMFAVSNMISWIAVSAVSSILASGPTETGYRGLEFQPKRWLDFFIEMCWTCGGNAHLSGLGVQLDILSTWIFHILSAPTSAEVWHHSSLSILLQGTVVWPKTARLWLRWRSQKMDGFIPGRIRNKTFTANPKTDRKIKSE